MPSRSEKVRKWVLRTGYPLELEVVDALRAHDWNVMASVNYFDEDETKWRELDGKAYKHKHFGKVACAPSSPYQLTFTLILQCKKSEKFTWIFFPTRESKELGIEYIDFLKVARVQSLASRDPISIRQHRILGMSRDILLEPPLFDPDIAREIKWLSELIPLKLADFQSFADIKIALTGITAPLSGSGKSPNQLFEAAATATKALVYEREITSNVYHASLSLFKFSKLDSVDVKPYFGINVILPVIVFDGSIYLWKGRNSDLKEIDHVVYSFDYRSPWYFGRYAINVIKKDLLDTFLEELDKDLMNLGLRLQEMKNELNRQVEMLR